MGSPTIKPRFAWQPLTPRGVAAFARASWGRVLLVQGLVALIVAGVFVWFLHSAWMPVITTAISRIPEKGQIRFGQLEWYGDSPAALAEGRFLSLAVDLRHEGEARSPAHVQFEFGRSDCKVFSLLGFVRIAYPNGWRMPFNRPELTPWWGAWAPPLLAMAAGAVCFCLMGTWMLLTALYALPAWLVGFFANRNLSLAESGRLAGVSLMPGALFMCGAILLYGLGIVGVVGLLVATVVHLVIGWTYVIVSPMCFVPHPDFPSAKANPFVQMPQDQIGRASCRE